MNWLKKTWFYQLTVLLCIVLVLSGASFSTEPSYENFGTGDAYLVAGYLLTVALIYVFGLGRKMKEWMY